MAKIGDLIPKSGMYTNPGVVVEKKDDGTVRVDTEPMTIHKYHRYSNTSGLSVEEKNMYNEILDQIYAKVDGMERLNDIQTAIDELKKEPKEQKHSPISTQSASYLGQREQKVTKRVQLGRRAT